MDIVRSAGIAKQIMIVNMDRPVPSHAAVSHEYTVPHTRIAMDFLLRAITERFATTDFALCATRTQVKIE